MDLASRTPPFSPAAASLNLPLPRPPAWICDFDDPERAAELLRRSLGLVGREDRDALGNWEPKLFQDGFALVFMDVHVLAFDWANGVARSEW